MALIGPALDVESAAAAEDDEEAAPSDGRMCEEHERRPTRRTRQHRAGEERRMRPRLLFIYVFAIAVYMYMRISLDVCAMHAQSSFPSR